MQKLITSSPSVRLGMGLWLLAWVSVWGVPPSYHVRQWTGEDGLPANRITSLAQTPDGYLWVGTWFGLVRFDGNKFVTWNLANTPGLPSEAITALAVDRLDGTLWVGTATGLARLGGGGMEMVASNQPGDRERWDVSDLVASRHGGVWVRAGSKIRKWPSDWKNWSLLSAISEDIPLAMTEVDGGWLEIVTSMDHVRVDAAGEVQKGVNLGPLPIQQVRWGALILPDGETKCVSSRDELWVREESQWKLIQTYPDGHRPVDVLMSEESGVVWVGVGGLGLWRHSPGMAQRMALGGQGAEKSVQCMMVDREANVWVGTTKGLFQLVPRLFQNFSTSEGLPGHECWSVAEGPDGSVWVRTSLGIARIAGDGAVSALNDEPVRQHSECVVVDDEGRVWMGAERHNGLVVWEPGGSSRSFWRSKGGVSGVDVHALYRDRVGNVWVGTERGPVLFQQGKPSMEFGEWGLPTNHIRSIYQTRDGSMWFGGWNSGVVQWKGPRRPDGNWDVELLKTNSGAGVYTQTITMREGLADDRVFVFHEDAGQALWIGTHRGLTRWANGQAYSFRTAQGLFDDLINWMEEDQQGRFWLSCNRGVFCMKRSELEQVAQGVRSKAHAIRYGTSSGMLSAETNGEHQPAGCKTRDGRIWFPTMDGVVALDPAQVPVVSPPALVVIERVMADGKEIKEGVRLPAGRARELQIHFTSTALKDPKQSTFQYRLTPQDQDWRPETQDRLAVYTNLRPGLYRFELRSVGDDSMGAVMTDAFSFELMPHFWERWWFFGVCGLLALGVVLGFTSYRLGWQHRLLSAQHAQMLADERARIARDLHDDLGTALTGVALEIDVVSRQTRGGAIEGLAHSANRVRQLAERMREVVWAINPGCDSVSSLVHFLEEQAGTLMGRGTVRLRFDFPEIIPQTYFDSKARHQIALAVREALNNVIRHAQAREAVLQIQFIDERLVVRVQDNGVGFEGTPIESSVGKGLHNMRTRMEQLGGGMILRSAAGHGTCIEFSVPLADKTRRKEKL